MQRSAHSRHTAPTDGDISCIAVVHFAQLDTLFQRLDAAVRAIRAWSRSVVAG
ncbi:MAG: hypothetical protein IPO52_15455 [Gemmatimonadetes bacterium]|nr:hypothetical protein [Gemmatimonadota bacterium]